MFIAGLHPCGLVMFLVLEDSVCDDQVVFPGKTQREFTVWVALANSTWANHTWPFVYLSNPGIEVSGSYQFISTRNSPQHFSQIVVEFLLKLFGVGHFWRSQLWRRSNAVWRLGLLYSVLSSNVLTFHSLSFSDILFPPSLLFTGLRSGSEVARTLLSQATLEPVWAPVFCALELHAKGQGQGKNARVQWARTGQDMLVLCHAAAVGWWVGLFVSALGPP